MVLIALALGLAGCGDDGDGAPAIDAATPDTDAAPESPSIAGDWTVTSGALLGALFPDGRTTGLVLRDDGTGSIVLTSGGADGCLPVRYLQSGDQLAMDLSAFEAPQVGRLFTLAEVGDDAITMFDGEGRIIFMERAAEPVCPTMTELSRLDGLPSSSGFADVEFDGTLLYYTSVDPTNGTRLRSVVPASGTLAFVDVDPPEVQALQGPAFWVAQIFAGADTVTLETPAPALLDTIDTGTLGNPVLSLAMAVNPADNHVWILGRPDTGSNVLLEVNPAGSPGTVIDRIALRDGLELSGLAYDGTNLWSVTTTLVPSLSCIDPATGEVIDSFQFPDPLTSWRSVAVTPSGQIFAIGEARVGGTSIVELAVPE